MKIREIRRNLFDMDRRFYLAHCISSDFALGAGIAVEFDKRYNIGKRLMRYSQTQHPTVILIDNIFNLVTKRKYWHKPTYENLEDTLKEMRDIIIEKKIRYLAMPRIGSGLDRLEWRRVKQIIEDVFKDVNIEIIVCYI